MNHHAIRTISRAHAASKCSRPMAALTAVVVVHFAGCDPDTPSEQDLGAFSTDGSRAGTETPTTTSTASQSLSVRFHPESKKVWGYTRGASLLLAEVSSDGLNDSELRLNLVVTPTAAAELGRGTVFGHGVVEVFVRPQPRHMGKQLHIELKASATGQGLEAGDSSQIEVIPWGNGSNEHADALLRTFAAHVSAEHPEIGLDPTTPWIESFDPYPRRLIVAHRTYLFDRWDLKVGWHVTIPPHDWAYVVIRPRDAFAPTMALCMRSQTGDRTIRTANLLDPRCVD